jgi:hypothetical protein
MKNSSWQAKQSIIHTTVTFCGDCVKMCDDFSPNFGDKDWLLHNNNALSHTPLSPGNCWPKKNGCRPHPPYFSQIPRLIQLRWSNTTSRMYLKMAEALGTV